MEIIRPRRLIPGDTIAVITPSSPAPVRYVERFRLGVKQLQGLGFRVVVGDCAAKTHGYRSASIADRAAEFNHFARSPEVACVISAIGGWNSNSLLPFIDWHAIQQNPKIYVGYSDVSALLMSIHARSRLVTFYGPAVVPSFGEWPRPQAFTIRSFLETLCDGAAGPLPVPREWTEEWLDWRTDAWKSRPRQMLTNPGWRCVRAGTAEGPLIGGNLNTMSGFIGSAYFPDVSGAIFFIEDTLQGLSSIERSLSMLRLHGVFDRIAGLVIGKPELLDRERAPFGLDELVLEVTEGFRFPIIAGVDLGHTAPMLTIPIGVRASMDASAGRISTLEPGVR